LLGISVEIVSIRNKTNDNRRRPGKRKPKTDEAKRASLSDSNELAAQSPSSAPSVSGKQARETVEGLIRREAEAITQAVIDGVKSGQFAQVKYLFEVGGIFPAVEESQESGLGESVTESLLRRLSESRAAAGRIDTSGKHADTRDEHTNAIE
jgi:hypothetical protein